MVNTPQFIQKTYQLSCVVMKAEHLPLFEREVYPFVSARVNGLVLTSKFCQKQNPVFNSRMQFPITSPILNNKITMRLWSDGGTFSANPFIANIPEHPCDNDFFNISKLLASDGRMAARWFNLYGVDPKERNSKTKGKREGSSYLGRILISFSVVPNEMPQFQLTSAQPSKEPRQEMFQLWVDVYEWINCKVVDAKQKLFVKVT